MSHEAKIANIRKVLKNFGATLAQSRDLVESFPPYSIFEQYPCPYKVGQRELNPLRVNKEKLVFWTPDEGFSIVDL
jgi:hypothetical protein